MKKILLALFSFIFVFSIVGCSTKTETKKEEKVIKMGFVPLKNSEKLVEDLKPISDYLSERLGVKVEAFTASNYIGVVEGLILVSSLRFHLYLLKNKVTQNRF